MKANKLTIIRLIGIVILIGTTLVIALQDEPGGNGLSNQGSISYSSNASAVAGEAADWKVYSDPEWGFSLKYPSEYNISPTNTKRGDQFVRATVVQISNPKDRGEFIPTFSVSVERQPFEYQGKIYSDVGEYARVVYTDTSPSPTFTAYDVGSLPAVKVSDIPVEFEGSPSSEVVFVIKDNVVFNIQASLAYPEFRKIASTFEFAK